jgi:probable HAF family extracellular repeat protein
MLAMAAPLIAQGRGNQKPRRYKLYLVLAPGDTDSSVPGGPPTLHLLNNQGTLGSTGGTSIPDPFFGFVVHAVQSRKGVSTDLGALPPADANFSAPYSASDNGAMVGISANGQIDPLTGFPEFEAVSFNGGGVTDLGNFGGNGSLAFSVNNRGQIVGYALNTVPDPYSTFLMGCSTTGCFPVGQQMRATLWDNGKMIDLGTLGGNDGVAGIINQSGQVAGTSYTNTTPNLTTGIPSQDPFFWERGEMVDVGNLGGTFAYANSMNERGQVVGLSTLAGDNVSHPFFWDHGKLTDIGTFGGTYGEAFAVNNAGQVVGKANFAGDQLWDAFLWNKGELTDLGNLGIRSYAVAINSSGQVVGQSKVAPGVFHGFLWEKGSGMMDLNDLIPPGSGLFIWEAVYINDRGQIAGNAILDSGEERAYLLTPCDDDCSSEMVSVGASTGVGQTGVMKAPPTDDEAISSFADLRRQLEQRHRVSAGPPVR